MIECDQKDCNNEAILVMKNKLLEFHINVCYTHYRCLHKESGMNWDIEKL